MQYLHVVKAVGSYENSRSEAPDARIDVSRMAGEGEDQNVMCQRCDAEDAKELFQ